MALTASEIQRVKFELGFHNLSINSEPYVSYLAFFDQVMQPYLLSGATTSSATTIAASNAPIPAVLTLASSAGFAVGQVVVVDVDARAERATVVAVSGQSITVQLSKAHGPLGYPVTVESAEAIIRDLLDQLRGVADTIRAVKSRVGLSRVDDVSFFGGGSSSSSQGLDPLANLLRLQEYYRDELASAVGIERLNSPAHGGGGGGSLVPW